MADLISRAAAIVEIYEYLQGGLDSSISELNLKLVGYRNGLQVAIRELQQLPAVDAAPVVHGRWIEESGRTNHWYCSNCGFVEGIVSRFYNYCPNCGEKMDGERRDSDA